MIDVSTLGKLLVAGPGRGRVPRAPLPEPLRRPGGRPHPLRRALHRRRPDHGRRHDRAARGRHVLRHDDLDRRRRRARLVRVVERGLADGRRDRERHRRARRGQRRRPALARAARAADRRRRLRTTAFKYLDAREAHGRGRAVPAAADRLRRRARLRAALPEPVRRAPLGHAARARRRPRRRPFGLEAQRILRLEKQHIIIGQDTDSESNVLDANMPWIAKLDKDDFVGKWALEHMEERGPRELLVGFEMENGALPGRGLPGRARRPAERARDERAPQRGCSGRRSASRGCRPSSPRRTRASRSASTGGSSRRACGCGRSSTPKASGCGRERPRLPLAVRGARGRRLRAARRRRSRGRSPAPRASATSRSLGKLEVRGAAVGEPRRRRGARDHADAGARDRPARALRRAAGRAARLRRRRERRARRDRGRGRDADAPAHRPRPRGAPGRGQGRRRAGVRDRERRRVPRSSSRRSTATTSSRSCATRRRGSREGHLPRPPHVAPAGRAEEALRRRHHRRRLARARDRVLPREEPRHHATSPCSRRATSARAPPAATRRSSARTTARPRARRSTARASSSTRGSPPTSTSTCSSRSRATSRSRTPSGRSRR